MDDNYLGLVRHSTGYSTPASMRIKTLYNITCAPRLISPSSALYEILRDSKILEVLMPN